MTAPQAKVSSRLFGPDMLSNPYPVYHELRKCSPVYWSDEMDGWLVTGYDAVTTAMRNPKLSVKSRAVIFQRKIKDPALLAMLQRGGQTHMLNLDPPAHTRVRSLVNKAFTPRAVEARAESIQQSVNQLLDVVQPRGRMDIIKDLGYPLPVYVIAAMLGIPSADGDKFKHWSDGL